MPVNDTENTKINESPLQPMVFRFVAVVAFLLIIIPTMPMLISNLAYSFSGDAPKIYWYLSRSSGFVTLTVLWASMGLGLGITNKMARLWPGAPAAFSIHQYTSILGLAFAAYHGLVLMGDHFVDFSLPRLMTPFSIAYETFWVGLGQICFYIWLLVVISFYVRPLIGQKTWRVIHYVNFVTYGMGFLHGLKSGTDSNAAWASWYFGISGISLIVLLAYRIYDSVLKNKVSLPKFGFKRVPKSTEPVPVAPKTRSVPQALLREQARNPVTSTEKPGIPVMTPVIMQPVSEEPAQTVMEEKAQQPVAEQIVVQTAEQKSPMPATAPVPEPAVQATEVKATSPSPAVQLNDTYKDNKVRVRIFEEPTTGESPARVNPIVPETATQAAEVKATTPSPVVRIQNTSRENKVRVRIFREPTTMPIPELQKSVERIQGEIQALFVRVKQSFRSIPVEPTTPSRRTGRVIFSDD